MFDVKKYIEELGNPAEITHLDLSNKGITFLAPDTFENLTQLEYLNLDGNQLSELPPALLEKNTQLKWLYLWGNQLSSLPPTLFEKNTQLKILYLNNNELSSLPPTLFEKNTQLKYLYLDNNELSSLPPILFEKNIQLYWLNLSWNQLTELPLPNKNVTIRGRGEIEQRREEFEGHKKKWKWVGADIETFPPCPSNYKHLPVFRNTFLGQTGGKDWVEGLEFMDKFNEEYLKEE